MKTPEISIVIGTLNRPKILLELIHQLEEISKTIPLEVLVFDQSDKNNYNLLLAKFPKKENFRLVPQSEPNTCRYLNHGYKLAKASIILYLDDDVSVSNVAILAHIMAFEDPKILGVAGRVINDNERISGDNRVGKIQAFGAKFHKNFSFIDTAHVHFPYGCNMSFRKSVLEKVNGFDEKLQPPIFAYNEIDLGVRINKLRRNSILFEPKARVLHHQYRSGGTRNNFSKKEIYGSTQFNYGYFIGKNYNILENIIFFIRRLPFQIMKEPRGFLYIIRGFIFSKSFRHMPPRQDPVE